MCPRQRVLRWLTSLDIITLDPGCPAQRAFSKKRGFCRGARSEAPPPAAAGHILYLAGAHVRGCATLFHASGSLLLATRAEMSQRIPLITTAAGTIITALPSEDMSEIQPMRVGDGTSPNRWIVNMLSANAEARWVGETKFTIAEFTGSVDMNRSSSATTIAG